LASERHFHTMLRRRQIDDYSMRVAHGPRPWSIAYGRVGFSSDVDTIEIRQVIEVVDLALCVYIRDAHATDLKAFHGKLILLTIVQRQCATAPLGSHASCDGGSVKRDFSRQLVLGGQGANDKQQSADQCQTQYSITPTSHMCGSLSLVCCTHPGTSSTSASQSNFCAI